MKKFLLTFFVSCLLPLSVSAATLHLMNGTNPVHVGDTFVVGLDMDTGPDSINAIEGALHYSPQSLTLRDIRLTGSIIPLWITPPASHAVGEVSFAGVIPGGYQGSGHLPQTLKGSGDVFTLVFEAEKVGTTDVSFDPETSVYRNDGNGTKASLSAAPLSITIASALPTPQVADIPTDTVPPESFVPSIVAGTSVGAKGMVLVFTTQDKDSGIDYYDVARSLWGNEQTKQLSWVRVESPYVLTNDDAAQYLYVRAVDTSGNTRVAIVAPQNRLQNIFDKVWWIVVLVIVGVLVVRVRHNRKHRRR